MLLAGLALSLAGCAGVPAAVVWTTVGAGLGFGAKAMEFDKAVLERTVPPLPPEAPHPPMADLPTPP